MSSGPPPLIQYTKPWLSVADQVSMLESRGLGVTNRADAEAFLLHFNYYRFSGYCLAFENPRHAFPAGVTFEQITSACHFDAQLRDLFNEALELIEVQLRTSVAYYFGEHYGAFGHTLATSFHPKFDNRITHTDWLTEVQKESDRSKELFVKHFKRTYAQFPDLPVWVVTEIMTFGTMARMVRAMHKHDRQNLALLYQIPDRVLFSLVLHLNYVRNLCAHHCRLWDRTWSIQPELPRQTEWQGTNTVSNQRLFATLLLMRKLMQRTPHNQAESDAWRDRVNDLFATLPAVANAQALLGLTSSWQMHPVWQ